MPPRAPPAPPPAPPESVTVDPSFGQLDAAPDEPAVFTEIVASPDPVPLAMFEPDDAKDTVSFAEPAGFAAAVTVKVPFSAERVPVRPATTTRSLTAKL